MPTLDASTPAAVWNDTASQTAIVSAAFTAPAGSIVVVKVTNAGANQTIGTPTATGYTFTRQLDIGTLSGHCRVALFTAVGTGVSQAITTTFAVTNQERGCVYEVWTDAALAATPATDSVLAGTGAPTDTITTVGTGSVVTWTNGDWNAINGDATRVYRSSATETSYHRSVGYTGYQAYQAAAVAGSQTYGLTAPTGQQFSMTAIEIQAGAPVDTGYIVQEDTFKILLEDGTGAILGENAVVGNYNGTATVALTFAVTATGAVGKASGSTVALTDTVAATGRVGVGSGASVALTATISATGQVGVSSGAAVALTATISTTGVAPTRATLSRAFWFRASSVGAPGSFTTWTDSSGNSRDGTGQGLLTAGSTPAGGNSVSFPYGNGTAFTLPSSGLTTAGEMWVVLRSTGVNCAGWSMGARSGFNDESHYPFSGVVYESFGLATTLRRSFTPTLSITTWRIYYVVSDGAGWTAELDGVVQSTTTGQTVAWPATPYVGMGGKSNAPDLNFAGEIAELYGRPVRSTAVEKDAIRDELIAEHGLASTYGLAVVSSTASVPLTATITATGVAAGAGVSAGASLPLTATVTATGQVGKKLDAFLGLTATVTATGQVATAAGATVPLTDTVASTGRVGLSAGATVPLSYATTATGASGVASGATIPLTDTVAATGQVGVASGSTVPLAFGVAASGQVGVTSGAALALTATVTATGVAAGSGVTGTASVPLTFAVTSTGAVGASSGSTLALTDTVTATGQVTASSGATVPLTDTVTSTGRVGTASSTTVAGTFAVTATGAVGAAGGASVTIAETFTLTATGTKAASAGATVTGTFAVTATGQVGKASTVTVAQTVTVAATGQTSAVAAATLTYTFGVTATGRVSAVGAVAVGLTFGVTATGLTVGGTPVLIHILGGAPYTQGATGLAYATDGTGTPYAQDADGPAGTTDATGPPYATTATGGPT